MRRALTFILLIGSVTIALAANPFTKPQKAWLDRWYLQKTLSTIDGDIIIDGTVSFEKLSLQTQIWISEGTSAWAWVELNSDDIADVLARTSNWDTAYNDYVAHKNIKTITTTTPMTTDAFTYWIDSSSGNVAAELPSASSVSGLVFTTVVVGGSNDNSVNPQPGDAINRTPGNFSLYLDESLSLRSDGGTNWYAQ